MTLEQLLRMKVETESGVEYSPDFRVAVQSENHESVRIIVHANGHSSETLDFIVKGNSIIPIGGR